MGTMADCLKKKITIAFTAGSPGAGWSNRKAAAIRSAHAGACLAILPATGGVTLAGVPAKPDGEQSRGAAAGAHR